MQSLGGLYAITDDVLLAGRLLPAVRAALDGGCRIVQYRSKQLDSKQRYCEATALRIVCHDYNALLLINDDVLLAQAVGADGVHIGQEDMSLSETRALLGQQAIIGVTCHDSLALALNAQAEGADYVAFGRFFGSSTKPSASPAPLNILNQARSDLRCPVVAIGGITLDNAKSLVDAGADMLAVVAGLFGTLETDTDQITCTASTFQSYYENYEVK
jgi:thiamine-phosphate pyrophosphorylase